MTNKIKLNPASILSQYSALGFSGINFLFGHHYAELHRNFFQLGFMQYSLFFDDWMPPTPMDFGYSPDAYDYLIHGETANQFTSPHVFEDNPMRIIKTVGGYEAYLARLNSKKRSEFKKCNTLTALPQPIRNPEFLMKCLEEVSQLHYEDLRSKTPDQWFDGSFNTRLASLYLVNYIAQNRKCMEDRSANAFILPVYDPKTDELICYTHCVSSMDDKVLYCLVDTHRADSYSAKAVTAANIAWACNNGYDYVDIDNHVYQAGLFELADQSSASKLAYKNIFFTGSYERKTYFSSQAALDSFKKLLNDAIQPVGESS